MYHSFFGLKEAPFSIVPNPDFLLLTPQHKEALAHLTFSTRTDGIVVLTGEAGTGKTTTIRTFLEQQSDSINTSVIIHPQLPALQMLQAICREFAISYDENGNFRYLLDTLWAFLLQEHSNNKRNILIIDEAHNLSLEVMEAVRMLTNLETTNKKLLQIVLVGQQELLDMLAQQQLRQIQQRVVAVFHLQAMDTKLVRQYMQHRMTIAGATQVHFDTAAYDTIAKLSHGIPRLINRLADRSLLIAYTQGVKMVTKQHVRLAASELPSQTNTAKPIRTLFVALLVMVFMGATVASSYVGYQWYQTWQSVRTELGRAPHASAPQDTPVITDIAQTDVAHKAQSAQEILFALWGQSGADCAQAYLFSFACIRTNVAFDRFMTLNTPALIQFEGQQVAFVQAHDLYAYLQNTVGEIRLPLAQLRASWNTNVTYVVPVPVGFADFLVAGSASHYTHAIQGHLYNWYAGKDSAIAKQLADRIARGHAVVDDEFARIVRQFQDEQQIATDGVFGIETYIRLMQLVDVDSIRLQSYPLETQ